jgi:hypothetical protein
MIVHANCVRKCDALEFVKVKSEVVTFPIWKETCLLFTQDVQNSLDQSSSLLVIIWDHEKGEFIDTRAIDSTTFASTTSIKHWIKNTRHDQRLGQKLSETISSGFISILQVAPRDGKQVCYNNSNHNYIQILKLVYAQTIGLSKQWQDLTCDFKSAVTPKDCFDLFEASFSNAIDKISLPDCSARISTVPFRMQAAPEVVTFLWPESQENGSGRITHAGRGKNCTHSQCFV